MKEIKLSQFGKYKDKYVALVDDEDFDNVNQFKWSVVNGKYTCYARHTFNVNGKASSIGMHAFILKTPKGLQVDHIDHNGLNNQRSNIRNCTKSQNAMNQTANGTSKYIGVSLHTIRTKYIRNRIKGISIYTYTCWIATIKHKGKYIYLGSFKIEEEAAKTYNEAAIKYHGKFANLNNI